MNEEPMQPTQPKQPDSDPEATLAFCRAYFRGKLRYHEQEEAKDLAADAWIRADRKLRQAAESGEEIRSRSGLLATICWRVFVDYIDMKRRSEAVIDPSVDVLTAENLSVAADQPVTRAHPHQHRRNMLMLAFEYAGIGDECRDLFARKMDGWSTREIARKLEIEASAAAKRMSRCYELARSLLGDDRDAALGLLWSEA